jgi:hypothetical protein
MMRVTESLPLLKLPFIEAATELGLTLFFMGIFIAVFALLHSMAAWLLHGFAFTENLKAVYHRLYSVAPVLLIFFLLLVAEGFGILAIQTSLILSAMGATIVFAILEEFFKYIINPFLAHSAVGSIGGAMVNALYVGLAFAFVENCLYFYFSYQSERLPEIIFFRSLITTLLHVGASGILGYFYGFSLFSKTILTNQEIEKGNYKMPFLMRRVSKETALKLNYVSRGFFLAAILHSAFNLVLGIGQRNLAILLTFALTLVVIILLRTQTAQMQYGLIGSKALPQEDYEKLRLQISVLQQIREIRLNRTTPATR